MADDRRLRVVLCWHMHQPDYREPLSGEYLAPWSYLHGIKDYTDMAAHLEHPVGAAAVVNFSPVLLDQIEDYCAQFAGFFAGTGKLRDPLLAALARLDLAGGGEAQLIALLRTGLRLQGRRMLERFPELRQLAELAEWTLAHPASAAYLDGHFTGDFLVWSHLAWLGESVRHNDARIARLMHKARNFSAGDRRELLHITQELLNGIVPRYRALAAGRRVELSMTPATHPLLPLLVDFASAREAHPDLPLPATAYPRGTERARWQIERGRQTHARLFGEAPAGCWPAEGALSTAVLQLLDEAHFTWTASGQRTLLHSLGVASASSDVVHRPYRLAGQQLAIFFRDDTLSDLIGFEYKSWRAEAAIADLLQRLGAIAADPQAAPGRVVSIVLDGENAWEHYPDNGYHFLSALYPALSQDPRLLLTTFSQCINDAAVPVQPLAKLVAGSWVKGELDTWIGRPDKNRAWELLVQAAQHCEVALGSGRLDSAQRARVEAQLAVCEGSDWFWWPGEDNASADVELFDRLFRMQLTSLYQLIGEAPPEDLTRPFGHRNPQGTGGAMRAAQ